MKYLITLFVLFFSFGVVAQKKKDIESILNDIGEAEKYSKMRKEISKKDSSWVVSYFDDSNVIVEKITYADPDFTIKHGSATVYENGLVSSKGNFYQGEKVGPWISYNKNRLAEEVLNYRLDSAIVGYVKYWENGAKKEEGAWGKNGRVGEFRIYYKSGNPALKEIFDEESNRIDSVYFDSLGKSTNRKSIVTEAEFEGGMDNFFKYLRHSIRYPRAALTKKLQGKVYLKFTIQSDGRIGDIEVGKSPGRELTNEAIRIIKAMPPWMPATFLGEGIETNLNIPISFTLSGY